MLKPSPQGHFLALRKLSHKFALCSHRDALIALQRQQHYHRHLLTSESAQCIPRSSPKILHPKLILSIFLIVLRLPTSGLLHQTITRIHSTQTYSGTSTQASKVCVSKLIMSFSLVVRS
jgi:hypothetical protein